MKNSKLKKPILFAIIGVVLAVIIAVCVIVFTKGDDKGKTDEGETTKVTEKAETEKEEAPEEVEESLFDYIVEIDGKKYTLPMAYQDFVNDGWVMYQYSSYTEETMIPGGQYANFSMEKGDKSVEVYVYNFSGNARTIKESPIGGVGLRADGVDAKIAKGITPSSTVDEVIAAFGEPDYRFDGSSSVTLEYYDNESYNNSVSFYLYQTDDMKKYSSITVKNFVATAADETTTDTTVPAYLSDYKAPTSIGTNHKSSVVKIAGDLYQLPAPVSEFVNKGWKITSKLDYVKGGETQYVTMERNGSKIQVGIINYADYQTIPENCAVWYVSVESSYKTNIEIADGLRLGDKMADAQSYATSDFDYYEGNVNYQWYYTEFKPREYGLTIYVDIETEKVSRIVMSCKTWDY